MVVSMRNTAMMLVLAALSAALGTAAARPLDSSDWPLEALAAVGAPCDGCFDPVGAVEVRNTHSKPLLPASNDSGAA
jgi:hypothetical protein